MKSFARRQANEQTMVVGLDFRVERGAVAADLSALCATVNDDKATARVGFGADRFHLAAAGVCAVAGIDVEVDRREAERAVVARREPQGQDFSAADGAYEAVVVFAKAFFLHSRTSFSVHKNFSPRIVAKRAFYGILIYTDGNGFI